MNEQKKPQQIGGTHVYNPFQKARLNAGLSQEQAAEKLSCATRTLQRYVSAPVIKCKKTPRKKCN